MAPSRTGTSAATAHLRPAATSATAVRQRIEEALRLDLVGPGPWGVTDEFGADLAEELIPGRVRPSNWYLTGFLVPDQTPPDERADPDEDDDSTAEVAENAGLAEESADEHRAAKRGFFPVLDRPQLPGPGSRPRNQSHRKLGRLHSGGDSAEEARRRRAARLAANTSPGSDHRAVRADDRGSHSGAGRARAGTPPGRARAGRRRSGKRGSRTLPARCPSSS